MNVNFNTGTQSPIITVNMSGKIFYSNDIANRLFPTAVRSRDVFKLIDKNIILKFAMLESGVNIICTKDAKYRYAIAVMSGTSFQRMIEIKFIKDSSGSFSQKAKENMYSYFNELVEERKTENINIGNLLASVVQGIKSAKGFIYKNIEISYGSDIEIIGSRNKLITMIISALFLMNEIDYTETVYINAENDCGNLKLNFSTKYKFGISPMKDVDIYQLFPNLSPTAMLLDALCEDMNVTKSIIYKSGIISLVFSISPSSNKAVKIYSGITADITLETERIIKLLDIYYH